MKTQHTPGRVCKCGETDCFKTGRAGHYVPGQHTPLPEIICNQGYAKRNRNRTVYRFAGDAGRREYTTLRSCQAARLRAEYLEHNVKAEAACPDRREP